MKKETERMETIAQWGEKSWESATGRGVDGNGKDVGFWKGGLKRRVG